MLLESESKKPAEVAASSSALFAPSDAYNQVPHYIYAGRHLELRLVADATPHGATHFSDGGPIGSAIDWSSRRYAPHFYVEQFSLLRKHALPLSSDEAKAHPHLRIKFKPISLGRHRMTAQIAQMFGLIEAQLSDALGLTDELDELRELLSDERIYRFVVMQIISLLHIVFDVLAFRSDIGFWKGRETMSGLSSRAVLSSAAQTLIVYLYLLDADGVNKVVIATYTVSTVLELWKVVKVLAIMRATELRRKAALEEQDRVAAAVGIAHCAGAGDEAAAPEDAPPDTSPEPSPEPSAGPSAEASREAASSSKAAATRRVRIESATERFDQVATHALSVGLAPLVAGWALYALVHYPHTSWYSWVVSSLADAVYLFGFVGMTPQLFINYKLKSVAHMPWRVMAYKAFNTFVDDAFAMLVAMPMHHRVACLRDDVVFFVFLWQRYLYPVDKTRANEYGIAYEREQEEEAEEDHDAVASEDEQHPPTEPAESPTAASTTASDETRTAPLPRRRHRATDDSDREEED